MQTGYRTVESSGTISSSYCSSCIHTPPPSNVTYWSGSGSAGSNSGKHATQHYAPMTRLAHSASLSRSGSGRRLSHKNSTALMRPVNVICGARHSPHSNIKIVLPAPLAPQLRNHMIVDPSTFRSNGEPLEQVDTTDQWMGTLTRTTSWHSSSDQNLSIGDDSSRQEANLSSGQRGRHSQDTIDHPRWSKLRKRSRSRTSSHCPIQQQPPGLGGPTPPLQPLDDQT